MKAVLDACVLYPTLLREILLGAAEAGFYAPVWSARIVEEWRRAAVRRDPLAPADVEIADATRRFPAAEVAVPAGIEARLSLPDPLDVHVLACAVAAGAGAVVTTNLRDFPGRTLAHEGVVPRHPDSLLTEFHGDAPEALAGVVATALHDLRAATGADAPDRALLKRAALPRLGRAIAGHA